MSLDSLACSLLIRFDQQGRIEDIEEAIKFQQAAVELTPKGHPSYATFLSNLACHLRNRFNRQRRAEDIEEAIKLHRATLELWPKGHHNCSRSLGHLAHSLTERFLQHGMIEDLEEAIKLFQEIVELFTESHPNHATSQANLVTTLHNRFLQHGRIDDLEEAIKLHQAALELCPEGHPSHSSSLVGLAESLYARIEQQWNVEEFKECMQLLELATNHTFSSLSWCLNAADRWVKLARRHDHNTALAVYKATILLLQRALIMYPTLHEQHDFLIRENSRSMLTLEAASYAIEKNQMEQAIEMLEQGRGLLWSQLRGFRAPLDRLAETNKDLTDKFWSVSRLATSHEAPILGSSSASLRSLPLSIEIDRSLFDKLLKLKRLLSNKQKEVINEIRRVPGFENFLEATPFEVLWQATSEGLVIVVNHCVWQSDALIIHSGDDLSVDCIPLDWWFYHDTINMSNDLVGTRKRFGADSPEYDEKLCKAMKMLWDRVVCKVVDKLTEIGVAKGARIWWCLTSVLSMLPFHAAGPYKDADGTTKYLLDDYVSSYTPSLAALINARSKGSGSLGNPKLLIVGDTTTLHSTRQEIRNIRNYMGSYEANPMVLLDRRASRRAIVRMLRKATWVHFACHGHLDPKPFDSLFKLADRHLTLLDIIQTNVPNAEFAFLSACHTAEISHSGAHDEALHLSAAMQFSGFRSVIGTMWEFYNEDGPVFARNVYEYMNDCDEGKVKYKRVAAGLWKAALELKARDGIPTEQWVNFVHIGA